MLLHADRLFLAQALAAAIGFGGKARALLGAQFVALERDRLHARLQLIAAKRRHQRENGGEHGDADQKRRSGTQGR